MPGAQAHKHRLLDMTKQVNILSLRLLGTRDSESPQACPGAWPSMANFQCPSLWGSSLCQLTRTDLNPPRNIAARGRDAGQHAYNQVSVSRETCKSNLRLRCEVPVAFSIAYVPENPQPQRLDVALERLRFVEDDVECRICEMLPFRHWCLSFVRFIGVCARVFGKNKLGSRSGGVAHDGSGVRIFVLPGTHSGADRRWLT